MALFHRPRRGVVRIAAGLLAALAGGRALAGSVDEFVIGLEEVVADGVPAAGAGNIEEPGAMDLYRLTVDPGTVVFFDELEGSCRIQWRCETSGGVEIFGDLAFCSGDPGTMTLHDGGEYTISVSACCDSIGTYSFTVWAVNPTEEFDIVIEQVVADGVPDVGAGNIEEPGTRDLYRLDVVAGTDVYIDELAGGCGLRWACVAPDGSLVFEDLAMCSTDPGIFTLDQDGTYTMTVSGAGDRTGTYSFTLWSLNPTQEFTIGLEEVVEDGFPAEGAGNIEEPGTADLYRLDVTAGTLVYFDELAGGCSIHWRCVAPDGSLVFEDLAMCINDPGTILLDQGGTYTITAYGFGGRTGTYSFVVFQVEPADEFDLDLEQLVADGVPGDGAGNIEEPGTSDAYRLDVEAGTVVYFDELAGPCGIHWTCVAPDGTVVFQDLAMCVTDPAIFTLNQDGTYTITAYGFGGTTGTYSFIVWAVEPPDEFDIVIDEVVADGVPGDGAGNIEEPGAVDVYRLAVDAETLVCFEELGGSCDVLWRCVAPDGSLVFEDPRMCQTNAGRFLLEPPGTYTLTVLGREDGVGTYSFVVEPGKVADLSRDCRVDFADILVVLAAWGTPDGDVTGDGTTDFEDILAVLTEWGG